MKKRLEQLAFLLTALLILCLIVPMATHGDGDKECTEHQWGTEPVEWVEPTCFEDGLYVYMCTVCYAQKNVIVPKTHSPGTPVQENVIEPTCTQGGSYDEVVRCTTIDCGAEISRTHVNVPALDHTPGKAAQENVVLPTCTQEGGYDEVVRCTAIDCGAEISRTHVNVPALGHIPGKAVRENEKGATCIANGSYDSSVYCTVCNVLLSQETIFSPYLGHTMTYIPAVEPDASGADGYMAYHYCKRCHLLFYDAIGLHRVSSRDSLVIRPKNDGALQVFSGKMEQNNGNIQTNYGAIDANYGTIAENLGSVGRQFYNMTTQMDAGSYSVKYDDSFQSVQIGKAGSSMFLEAGQSGIITLSATDGRRIARVTYLLNGEELELEDLGGGKYRLTAPGMPEGVNGFALNEGCLRVEMQTGIILAGGGKSESLRRLEAQDSSIGLFSVMARDKRDNRDQPAIWVEGMDLDAADIEFKKALSKRTDIRNALAEAAFGSESGTMIFVLDNGARIVCDIARTRKVIGSMLPTIQYTKSEEEKKRETLEEINKELVNNYQDSTYLESRSEPQEGLEINIVFKEEEKKVKFEEDRRDNDHVEFVDIPKPPEPEQSKKCLAPDTMILLADGTEKRVDQLQDTDRLLVWDFDQGCLADAPITFFHIMKEEAPLLRVSFSDGTSVGIVGEHVFFDLTARQFVAIRDAEQAAQLVGHSFAKLVEGQIKEVTLTGIQEDGVVDSYYSPVSQVHFNCFANGMLNISGFMQGLYNVFDLEADSLKYDAEKKALELQVVGELPYEIFEELFPRELFESNQVSWLSVSVAKQKITLTELYDLFAFCGPFFVGTDAQ